MSGLSTHGMGRRKQMINDLSSSEDDKVSLRAAHPNTNKSTPYKSTPQTSHRHKITSPGKTPMFPIESANQSSQDDDDDEFNFLDEEGSNPFDFSDSDSDLDGFESDKDYDFDSDDDFDDDVFDDDLRDNLDPAVSQIVRFDQTNTNKRSKYKKSKDSIDWKKVCKYTILLILFITVGITIWVYFRKLKSLIKKILKHRHAGVLLLWLTFVFQSLLCLPTLPLTLAGGYTYGTALGSGVITVCSLSGVCIGFLISRFLLRSYLRKRLLGIDDDKALRRERYKAFNKRRKARQRQLNPEQQFVSISYQNGINNKKNNIQQKAIDSHKTNDVTYSSGLERNSSHHTGTSEDECRLLSHHTNSTPNHDDDDGNNNNNNVSNNSLDNQHDLHGTPSRNLYSHRFHEVLPSDDELNMLSLDFSESESQLEPFHISDEKIGGFDRNMKHNLPSAALPSQYNPNQLNTNILTTNFEDNDDLNGFGINTTLHTSSSLSQITPNRKTQHKLDNNTQQNNNDNNNNNNTKHTNTVIAGNSTMHTTPHTIKTTPKQHKTPRSPNSHKKHDSAVVDQTNNSSQDVTKSSSFWQTIDQVIADDGFTLVFLLRFSPLHPYGLFNYLFGLTSVSFPQYLLASAISMFPTTLMEVYLGSALKNVKEIIGVSKKNRPIVAPHDPDDDLINVIDPNQPPNADGTHPTIPVPGLIEDSDDYTGIDPDNLKNHIYNNNLPQEQHDLIKNDRETVVFWAGLVFTLMSAVALTFYIKNKLNQKINQLQAEQEKQNAKKVRRREWKKRMQQKYNEQRAYQEQQHQQQQHQQHQQQQQDNSIVDEHVDLDKTIHHSSNIQHNNNKQLNGFHVD